MKKAEKTLLAIDEAIEANQSGHRPHLGASEIGQPCTRAAWYSFRWTTEKSHNAQLLRIFDRGHREEARFIEWLKNAGCGVHTYNGDTGKQFSFQKHSGHFSGSADGFALNVPDCPPGEWVLLEFKTANKKSFEEMAEKGVELAKPQHFAQVQTYMGAWKIKRALYMMICKDDDRIHAEIVDFDPEVAEALDGLAKRIIFDETPPPRIASIPTWFQCKFCDHSDFCHGYGLPAVNCRTCAHSTPFSGPNPPPADSAWECDAIATDGTKTPCGAKCEACPLHVYHPALLNWQMTTGDAQDGRWIEFIGQGGEVVKNGPDFTPSKVWRGK